MKLSSSPPSFRTIFLSENIVPKISFASSAALSRGCREEETASEVLIGGGDGGCDEGREEFRIDEEESGRSLDCWRVQRRE